MIYKFLVFILLSFSLGAPASATAQEFGTNQASGHYTVTEQGSDYFTWETLGMEDVLLSSPQFNYAPSGSTLRQCASDCSSLHTLQQSHIYRVSCLRSRVEASRPSDYYVYYLDRLRL